MLEKITLIFCVFIIVWFSIAMTLFITDVVEFKEFLSSDLVL